NRPVQGVLGDATLVEVARRKPSSRGDLERIRGLGANAQGRRAEELLQAISGGARRPADPAPQTPRPPAPRPDDAPLVALAESLPRARGRGAGGASWWARSCSNCSRDTSRWPSADPDRAAGCTSRPALECPEGGPSWPS